MEAKEILNQVQEIFRDILDNEEIVLSLETSSVDIEEWDSLSHIQLIVAIEKEFKVRFNAQQIRGWKNVGEMIEDIKTRINA